MAYAFGFHSFGFGLGFLNFLGTVLFFIVLVWAIKFLVRGGYGGWHGGRYGRRRGCGRRASYRTQDDALQAARERLAQGQLSTEEFERIKRELSDDELQGAPSPLESWFREQDEALTVARLRLARGELSLEEFETLKRALQS